MSYILRHPMSTVVYTHVPAGRVGEGRHEGHPGHPRPRDHPQPAGQCQPLGPLHVEPPRPQCAGGGPRAVHVPDKHGPDEESGKQPPQTRWTTK